MTANEDAALDLDAIEAKWLHVCGSCDAGLNYDCTCPSGDPRSIIQILIAEVRTLRASIGPDSERIRELEAENERLWQRLKANAVTIGRYRRKEMIDSGVMESNPDPAAGQLPGPDDIVVSREALRAALVENAATTPLGAYNATVRRLTARDALLAALSQPHPAQEQQQGIDNSIAPDMTAPGATKPVLYTPLSPSEILSKWDAQEQNPCASCGSRNNNGVSCFDCHASDVDE